MVKNLLLVAIRNFWRHPGISLLNIAGLAVGFTCMLLTVLWVFTEFSFDQFHREPDNLYKVVSHVETDGSFQTFEVASASIDVSSISEVDGIVTIATGDRWPNELCLRKENAPNECVYIKGIYATGQFFEIFDFEVIDGATNPLQSPTSIAISQKMAQALYGNEDPIGKTLNVDDHYPVQVSAVFADVPTNSTLQFDFVIHMNVFSAMRGLKPEYYASQFFTTVIRTNQFIAPEELTQKLNDSRVLPEKLKADKISYEAFPLANWRLKNHFEDGKNAGGRIEYIVIFTVIAILVVVLAAINFVNVSTARATVRAKEIGVRKVTGALRSHIVWQFMSESFLMVLIAFVLAAGITQFALPYFEKLIDLQISVELFSGWIPLYVLAFLIVVSLFSGLYPAFVMSSFQPIRVLKNQITAGHGSGGLRKVLLVTQLGISIAILSFGGVLFMQLRYIAEKQLGIDHQQVIRIEPTFKMLQKFETFKNVLSDGPFEFQTATASANPLDLHAQNTGVSWPGKPDDMRVTFQTVGVSHEFVETFGLKILDGQDFDRQPLDTVNNEVLISQDAAQLMELKNPIGEVIHIGDASCRVVGIVNNFHTRSLHEARLPVILYRANYVNTSGVYVKYPAGKTMEALGQISKAYEAVEPAFTMKYQFQDERFDKLYKVENTASTLVLLFSLIALTIAVIGITGLATFNVMRRMKELSIRKVFGATSSQLLSLLSKEFLVVVAAAALIGVPLVWLTAERWLGKFAYRIDLPWWMFISTVLIIAVVTLLIIVRQGMKAVVGNPTQILRNE